jgi:hypothetical protein
MSDELGITLTLVGVLLTSACGRAPDASRSSKAVPAASVGAARAGSMNLAATLDGVKYSLTGDGECSHADEAAIYDVPAAMWHATLKSDGPVSYVNLTVWQFKGGAPAQFSLGLQVGGAFHHASTIKGATLEGTGTAEAAHAGETAVLHANGTDKKGVAFDLTIRCSRVTQGVEEVMK